MKSSDGGRWPPEIRVAQRRQPVRRGWELVLGMGVAILLVVGVGAMMYTVFGLAR